MPASAPLSLDWEVIKLNFLELRSKGVQYEATLKQLSEQYGVAIGTVRGRSSRHGWNSTLRATKVGIERRVEQQIALSSETIATNVGNQLLEQITGMSKVKARRPIDCLQKAQALKTLAEVPSRFNPDSQLSQGSTKASFNFNFGAPAQPIEQAKVVEAEVVSSVLTDDKQA